MVAFFDHAFRLRTTFPDQPVLMYAMGLLFRVRSPSDDLLRVAESAISQSILAEPGCAQKAFALLTYWDANGAPFTRQFIVATIDRLCVLHESRGLSSDMAWALAFAIQNALVLSKSTGTKLSRIDDDAVAIEALHAHQLGLLPGLRKAAMERAMRDELFDRDHWLLFYEGVRQGHFPALASMAPRNSLMNHCLMAGVEFYRTKIPSYAMLIHPGGAPEWVVNEWLTGIRYPDTTPPVPEMVSADLARLVPAGKTAMDLVKELLNRLSELDLGPPEEYE